MRDTLYTGSIGCTTYLDGERGTTVGLQYGIAHHIDGAFVKMFDGGMRYVRLGSQVAACCCGRPDLGKEGHHQHCNIATSRKTSHEILSHYSIDRNEFDRITGLDKLRAELGWED